MHEENDPQECCAFEEIQLKSKKINLRSPYFIRYLPTLYKINVCSFCTFSGKDNSRLNYYYEFIFNLKL